MSDIQLFYLLKEAVLLEYRNRHPYFQGNWKTFSSQDIQNLMECIGETTRQTVSEKWIYTHLKPEINEKLPRKDMLDILSRFSGFSGWEEFVYVHQHPERQKAVFPKRKIIWVGIFLVFLSLVVTPFFWKVDTAETKIEETINLPSNADLLQENTIKDSVINSADAKKSVAHQGNKPKDTINGKKKASSTQSLLEPDDFSLILKAFMQSDIKDWETRKEQLNKILSDDLEVVILLRDHMGAEYLNKKEFSQKLIIPTASVRKMNILDLQTDTKNQVRFIRIQQ